jgi:hypothetical protein
LITLEAAMNTTGILIIAMVIVLGWFAVGLLYNLRRGNGLLRWIQQGLPLMAEKTTFRWLGSSVAEMNLVRPKKPFRSLILMVVLAPRDIPWLWLLAALRGRSDILIFRAELASPVRADLELVNPQTWTGRMAAQDAQRKGWEMEPSGDLHLYTPAGSPAGAQQALSRLEPLLPPLGSSIHRLSLRSEGNRLEIHAPFPEYRSVDARSYIQSVQKLAEAASNRP